MDINKGFNTYINDFKKQLVDEINQSGLPVGIIYYILKDLFHDIEDAYQTVLINEKDNSIKQTIQDTIDNTVDNNDDDDIK